MGDVEYAIVAIDAAPARALSAAAKDLDGRDPEVVKLHGLGGSVGDWMLVATLAASVVSSLLTAVYPYVEGRRIKSIKVGDVEIMHPRPEDVTKLLELYLHRGQDEPSTDK
ncbi:hypothetical protein [Micromonospora sp. CPCC 205558]|uniref:hypothetical protein n=1 Tax=Micromonospora sp. CPCC 205558 TaxID=3122403 RepID=UPI002FF2192E